MDLSSVFRDSLCLATQFETLSLQRPYLCKRRLGERSSDEKPRVPSSASPTVDFEDEGQKAAASPRHKKEARLVHLEEEEGQWRRLLQLHKDGAGEGASAEEEPFPSPQRHEEAPRSLWSAREEGEEEDAEEKDAEDTRGEEGEASRGGASGVVTESGEDSGQRGGS
uniref:SWI2/SNF2-containing protein RAD54 n=1 Tax=Steinernema glaseri TaxID=37863 RepID=A0A1I7ZSL6_9BILA